MTVYRPRCYVAGPITADTKERERQNVNAASIIGKELYLQGWAPLVPHWSWWAEREGDIVLSHEDWLCWDMPWVHAADAVYRLPGESIGAEREVGQAHLHNIPVVYSLDESKDLLSSLLDGPRMPPRNPQSPQEAREPVSAPQTILDEAKALVWGDRQRDYGHPREDFARSAALMSAILGAEVRTDQVPLLMIAVKVSRLCERYKRDSVVDLAGYAATLERVMEE